MKRIVGIFLAVFMVSTLCTGCNVGNKSNVNTFKIGGVGPLTGESSYYGQEVYNGMQLAVNEINEKGGICDAAVEINFQDDAASVDKIDEAYKELKVWGAHTVVGATTSDACIALAKQTCEDNLFQITPSGSAVECAMYPNVYQVCFSDPNQGRAAAEYIAKKNIAKKVAVIFDSSSAYSAGVYAGFQTYAGQCGVEIVAVETFTVENNVDFTKQLYAAKQKGAELIFIPVYYQQASVIMKQADELNYKVKFLGCDGLDGILEAKDFDKELAEGLMFLSPYVADVLDVEARTFTEKYKEAYGVEPSQFAADAYDAVYIIKTAAEEAGIKVKMSPSAICDAMSGVMTVIQVDGVTSGEGVPMKWDENGMVDKEPKAAIIVDGKYRTM